MENEQTDKTDTPGKEADPVTPKPEEPNKVDPEISPLDRLETANKEKKELLDREEKILEKREKISVAELAGGRAMAGQTKEEPKKLTDEEYAAKFMKGEADPLGDDGIEL